MLPKPLNRPQIPHVGYRPLHIYLLKHFTLLLTKQCEQNKQENASYEKTKRFDSFAAKIHHSTNTHTIS